MSTWPLSDARIVRFCGDRDSPYCIAPYEKSRELLVRVMLQGSWPRINVAHLKTLHNTYMLVGDIGSDKHYNKKAGDKKWKHILTESEYESLKRDDEILLGVVVVNGADVDDGYVKFEYAETLITPGMGVFQCMMKKLTGLTGHYYIPSEVSDNENHRAHKVMKVWCGAEKWDLVKTVLAFDDLI